MKVSHLMRRARNKHDKFVILEKSLIIVKMPTYLLNLNC